MKKLVAMVAIEIVGLTCLGLWMSAATQREPRPNAFTALGYALVVVFD